jgi:hypothetical protein
MDEERLREVALERAYVMEAARWDSIICRGLIEDTLPALVAEVDVLRQLLRDYGRHNEGCSAAHGPQYRCRCGWREVAPGLGADDAGPAERASTVQADQYWPVGAQQGAERTDRV